MTELQQFTSVFAPEQRQKIDAFLRAPGWETGWKSSSKRDPFSFLHKHFAGHRKAGGEPYDCEVELFGNAPDIHAAWLQVKDKLLPGHKLVRCYANGMTFGMEGTVHTDANDPGNYTTVYYPHERWSPNWGGETIFYAPEENAVLACVFPRPNSAVMFDGRIPHRANGVTRLFAGLRITLMFKTEHKNGCAA